MTHPAPRPSIMNVAAYSSEDFSIPNVDKIYNLSMNENPLGASPKAKAAFTEAAQDIGVYPDGDATVLRHAIADKYGINADQILCGNGSDELLTLLSNCYITPGDEGIYCEHGFLVYPIVITAAGGTPVIAKEKNLTADVDAILAKVTAKTKLVFLANPNNPTGTYLPFKEVKRLHAGLPAHVILVLDAAYAEFVEKDDYQAGMELVSASRNVVMTRTFSKIYALAGLRLGWVFGSPDVIGVLNRTRNAYNINGPALAAGVAAIKDDVHIEESQKYNKFWVNFLVKELNQLGLRVSTSVGNFLLIAFPEDPSLSAKEAEKYLRTQGIVLRSLVSYGFPNALRLSIGTEEANQKVIMCLKRFLLGSKKSG